MEQTARCQLACISTVSHEKQFRILTAKPYSPEKRSFDWLAAMCRTFMSAIRTYTVCHVFVIGQVRFQHNLKCARAFPTKGTKRNFHVPLQCIISEIGPSRSDFLVGGYMAVDLSAEHRKCRARQAAYAISKASTEHRTRSGSSVMFCSILQASRLSAWCAQRHFASPPLCWARIAFL